ncbi:MAG: Ig-like domain-containing protein, partial [Pseudomonadota bacterium]
GNSQSLDHILVSDALLEDAEFDIVHTNSEIFEDSARASDHDPLVVGLTLGEDGDDPVDTLGLWLFASGEEGLNSAENFDNPAQFLGGAMAQDGQAMLDGENDYILIDNIDDYEVQAGGLRMAFSVESLDGNSSGSNFGAQRLQALFSRDSSGFDGGGHLTGYVDGDGVIVIRHQTDDENYVIRTDPGVVSNGDQVALEYEFDPVNGMVLKVGINGAPLEIVGTNDQSILDGTPVSLVGNSEPWTLGVSQTRSGNGVASNLRQYFEGKIDSFEVFSGDGDPGIPSENSDPMAVNDTGTTAFETAIELDVIENDSDPDGDALVIASAGDAANGMVSVTDDNTLLYQPDTDFFGTDTFIYTVSDGNGGTATATVGVTVEEEPSNPMPTASLGEWLFEPDAPTANTAPGFENPAVFANGAEAIGGAVILDGEDDYVLISNIDDYEVGAVEVRMSFSVDTLSGTSVGSGFGSQELQTLFSRDSSGFDGGGHLTAFVNGDGSLRIRHQTEDANYAIDTLAGLFDEGDDVDLIYKVTPTDGMELYLGVNGGDLDMVGSNDQSVLDGNPVDLIGNSEPWTLGASQTRSNDETANKLRSFFDGSIDSFEIIQPSDDLFS